MYFGVLPSPKLRFVCAAIQVIIYTFVLSDLIVLYTMLVSNYFVHNIHHHMLVFFFFFWIFCFYLALLFSSWVLCGVALLCCKFEVTSKSSLLFVSSHPFQVCLVQAWKHQAFVLKGSFWVQWYLLGHWSC